MNEIHTHEQCHNPACRRPVVRRLAFLRSISLEQVAFCSRECVEEFDQLDAANGHRPQRIPAQRRASETGGRMSA